MPISHNIGTLFNNLDSVKKEDKKHTDVVVNKAMASSILWLVLLIYTMGSMESDSINLYNLGSGFLSLLLLMTTAKILSSSDVTEKTRKNIAILLGPEFVGLSFDEIRDKLGEIEKDHEIFTIAAYPTDEVKSIVGSKIERV